ncbi:unnamed protein product [Rotaria sordida]|uniref:Glycosyl transferase 64 domain-containing protein n=2 Tax=Rotaria sordida TaxID=392033 RepID=A0A819CPE3_9BILA|nr:unnamed protein product [Rotaria sordida]
MVNISKTCDYIFTHDDDLTFHIKQQFNVSETSLSNLLISILKTYRPAIAGFPWSVGDKSILAMKELAAVYRNEAITPLTGFDNGMVIYHKSIVNFFIPFSPRGEGGFRGEWTLCAHFLQMFAHLLFGKYAIRLNMFEYNNSINIDSVPHQNKFTQRTRIENGVAIPIHILKMKNNSLNNRFYPYKEIRTDCIINMDDDWDMPYSHMAFAIDTWRGHFFNNLVGFSHQGRNHIQVNINGTRQYVYSNKLLVPRQKAFYIANATKQGPVVIDASAKAYNFGGLWKRPTHMKTRTVCLNKFVKIFGRMPLKYTMTTTDKGKCEDASKNHLNDLVLNPFAESGITLVAAANLK